MLKRLLILLVLVGLNTMGFVQVGQTINRETRQLNSTEFDSLRRVWLIQAKKNKLLAAKKRLADAKYLDRGIEKLNLSDVGLKKLPAFIKEYHSLKRLEVRGNELRKIPKKVLKNIEYLDLSNNPLSIEKFKFKKNRSITHLVLNQNQLSQLPRSIKKLKVL